MKLFPYIVAIILVNVGVVWKLACGCGDCGSDLSILTISTVIITPRAHARSGAIGFVSQSVSDSKKIEISPHKPS